MEKKNQPVKNNTDTLFASILWRGGLDKLSIIEMFIHDYYCNIDIVDTSSVRNRFFDQILLTLDKKPNYSPAMEKSLISFYQANFGDLMQIKELVYSFMDEQELWDMDYVADFKEFVYYQVDHFMDDDNYHFDWKIDDMIFNQEYLAESEN